VAPEYFLSEGRARGGKQARHGRARGLRIFHRRKQQQVLRGAGFGRRRRDRQLCAEPRAHVCHVVDSRLAQQPRRYLVDLLLERRRIAETPQMSDEPEEVHLLPGRRLEVHVDVQACVAGHGPRGAVRHGREEEQVAGDHRSPQRHEHGGDRDDDAPHGG
jgi:hypothetical protein